MSREYIPRAAWNPKWWFLVNRRDGIQDWTPQFLGDPYVEPKKVMKVTDDMLQDCYNGDLKKRDNDCSGCEDRDRCRDLVVQDCYNKYSGEANCKVCLNRERCQELVENVPGWSGKLEAVRRAMSEGKPSAMTNEMMIACFRSQRDMEKCRTCPETGRCYKLAIEELRKSRKDMPPLDVIKACRDNVMEPKLSEDCSKCPYRIKCPGWFGRRRDMFGEPYIDC